MYIKISPEMTNNPSSQFTSQPSQHQQFLPQPKFNLKLQVNSKDVLGNGEDAHNMISHRVDELQESGTAISEPRLLIHGEAASLR